MPGQASAPVWMVTAIPGALSSLTTANVTCAARHQPLLGSLAGSHEQRLGRLRRRGQRCQQQSRQNQHVPHGFLLLKRPELPGSSCILPGPFPQAEPSGCVRDRSCGGRGNGDWLRSGMLRRFGACLENGRVGVRGLAPQRHAVRRCGACPRAPGGGQAPERRTARRSGASPLSPLRG